MGKKALGLLLIATLIAIMIIGAVRANLEKNEEIPAANLGNVVEFPDGSEQLAEGEMAPDFELRTLAGETIRLSDLKGRKVMLNFWASWCAPCRTEMPHMQDYYEEHAEEANVEILAVNMTDKDHGMEKIESFADNFGLTFPLPLDETGEVGNAYEVLAIPTTFMIDTEGRLQTMYRGPMNEEVMTDLVANLE